MAGLATGGAAAALVPAGATSAAAQGTGAVCVELPPENAEVFNATCQYCMVQCGYKVSVWEKGTGRKPTASYTGALSGEWVSPSFVAEIEKDGKQMYAAVVSDAECVVNRGDYSVRGGTNAQTLFAKNQPVAERRILAPMIRKNGKRSPLEAVGWDEAIEFVADKLTAIKDEHGPDALSLIWGDWLYNLPTYSILKLWFTCIGSSTHSGNGWFFDEQSAGISATFGTGTRSFTEEDFDETSLLITMGTNLEANGSVHYHRFFLNGMSAGNAKHIEIDPRRTDQAALAERYGGLHLKVRPGHDAVLLAAIMREIIARDAYDKEFVAEHVSGFETLAKTVSDERFSLASAARETWLTEAEILRAVDMIIAAKGKTMLLHEKGVLHQMAAFQAQGALGALGTIMGNVGKSGACTSRAGGHPSGSFVWPSEPESRSTNKNMYQRLEQGGVKATWAFASNFAKQLPSLTKTLPLINEGFVVVQDRIHSEMDEYADVLLPAATWGETDSILGSVTRRLRLTQQFMDPPGEARPDWWIVAQVAKKMGFSGFDWRSAEDVWDEMRPQNGDIKDITWQMLLDTGTNGVRVPYVPGKESPDRLFSDEYEQFTGKRFATKDGKANVAHVSVLQTFDPKEFEWGEISESYPLMAIDFRLNELWNTGYTYWDKPLVNARTPDAYVHMHTQDAMKRGIATGDKVELRSPYGKCSGIARVDEGIAKGVVGIPALFPKQGQEFNFATRPNASPVNGDFDTMVAAQIVKVG